MTNPTNRRFTPEQLAEIKRRNEIGWRRGDLYKLSKEWGCNYHTLYNNATRLNGGKTLMIPEMPIFRTAKLPTFAEVARRIYEQDHG